MSVEDPAVTIVWQKIRETMLDDVKMAPLLQGKDCKKEWLVKNTAVACAVQNRIAAMCSTKTRMAKNKSVCVGCRYGPHRAACRGGACCRDFYQ